MQRPRLALHCNNNCTAAATHAPAVLDRHGRDVVTQQRAAFGAAAVHHLHAQHPAYSEAWYMQQPGVFACCVAIHNDMHSCLQTARYT